MRKVVKSVLAMFMAFSVVGCSSSSSSSTDSTYKAGTYTASEQGFGGEVTVTITGKDNYTGTRAAIICLQRRFGIVSLIRIVF